MPKLQKIAQRPRDKKKVQNSHKNMYPKYVYHSFHYIL